MVDNEYMEIGDKATVEVFGTTFTGRVVEIGDGTYVVHIPGVGLTVHVDE